MDRRKWSMGVPPEPNADGMKGRTKAILYHIDFIGDRKAHGGGERGLAATVLAEGRAEKVASGQKRNEKELTQRAQRTQRTQRRKAGVAERIAGHVEG